MIMLFGTNTYYANSTFNYKRQSMRIYDKLDLKKIITSDSNNIKYSSSNENVAKVDENGIVSSYNQGQVTITIQDENSTSNLILSCGFLVGMDVSRWNGNIDWDEVKQRLFNVDSYESPKVIVSVLMLREGFDVNNICVIVPLSKSILMVSKPSGSTNFMGFQWQ